MDTVQPDIVEHQGTTLHPRPPTIAIVNRCRAARIRRARFPWPRWIRQLAASRLVSSLPEHREYGSASPPAPGAHATGDLTTARNAAESYWRLAVCRSISTKRYSYGATPRPPWRRLCLLSVSQQGRSTAATGGPVIDSTYTDQEFTFSLSGLGGEPSMFAQCCQTIMDASDPLLRLGLSRWHCPIRLQMDSSFPLYTPPPWQIGTLEELWRSYHPARITPGVATADEIKSFSNVTLELANRDILVDYVTRHPAKQAGGRYEYALTAFFSSK